MKSHRLAIRLLFSLLVLGFAVAAVGISVDYWHHVHLSYPTQESESYFLRNYTPEHVVTSFSEGQSSSHAVHMTGSAGREYVSHEGGLEFYVALRQENRIPLMNGLRDYTVQELARYGAIVHRQSGDPLNGFHFDYEIGKTLGSLTILPVEINPSGPIHRGPSLPAGMEDVCVRFEQVERWFPRGPRRIETDVTDSVH